jgi:sulfopyruvate decarboxylase subunit beta
LKRIDCLRSIYPELEDCAVVTIMGAVAAELYSLGHRPNFFYLEHAMGLASSIGLGVALAQPKRKVVVFDGDGSVLMNLGGLTTTARQPVDNLVHIVFDNEVLLSVGGGAPGGHRWFTSATAERADISALALAAGYSKAETVHELGDFTERAKAILQTPGLACLVAKVEPVSPATFHMDVHMLENRFEFARWLQRPVSPQELRRPDDHQGGREKSVEFAAAQAREESR